MARPKKNRRAKSRSGKPTAKPEIILRKQVLLVTDEDGTDTPVQELLILANRAGYRWLSKYFMDLSKLSIPKDLDPYGDPDYHLHLDSRSAPFNGNISDEFAFRLGTLTRANRRAVFKKYMSGKFVSGT